MTKILILHASLGSGHVSAANSVASALRELGVDDVHVEDGLDYANSFVRTVITKGYLRISEESPSLWRMLYEGTDNSDLQETLESNKEMGQLQRPFYKKLERLIHDYDPDAIISTQQFPLLIVQALKENGRISQPNYVIVTDFMAHSSWLNEGVTRYFVASQFTKDALAYLGVPEDLLHVTGIPVKPEIALPKDTAEMREKHGLAVDQPLITLFGGGIDPQRVRRIVRLMLDSPTLVTLVTVAGRNQKMQAALADLQDSETVKQVKHGRIDFVDDLVAASDLVITKSGGLIVSEVLARGTPMIVVDPIPGQEEWNADFVAGVGAGVQIRLPEMVPAAAISMLHQPERLESMKQQAGFVGYPNAAMDIARYIISDLAE